MSSSRFSLRKILPLVALICLLILFFVLRTQGHLDFLTFEWLKQNRDLLKARVEAQFLSLIVLYGVLYVIVAAASLPIALYMTILGGFLFGPLWGTLAVVLSATTGATIVFLAARYAIGDWLAKRAGKNIRALEQGFQKNATSYLLFLRLVPIFPFFLINIAAAVFSVRLPIFFLTTLVGIIPGTFVFVLTGDSLDSIFAAGDFSASAVLTPKVIAAFCGLGILSLVPILYRRFKGKDASPATD